MTKDLGNEWLLFDISCKSYACHMSFHPIIDSAVEFKGKSGVGVGEIQGVKVVTNPTVVRKHGQNAPTTILGAQYSLPFSLAIAFVRDIKDPATFNDQTLWDEDVRALAGRVGLEAREMGVGPMAEVTINSAGREHRLEAMDWKGAPSNPYTLGEMSEKFRTYASGSLSEERIEEVIGKVEKLEDERDAGTLARLLTPDVSSEN